LLLAYPITTHFSVISHRPSIIVAVLLGLTVLGLAIALRRGSQIWSVTLAALLVAGFMCYRYGTAENLVFLPPVLINLALFLLFGRTLLPGRVPLITRFATMVRGPIDSVLARYTRRLTMAWAAFFAVMTLESIALALFAPIEIWSLFTNFLNYFFVLLFFIVEYYVRVRCLSSHSHPSFLSFCRMLVETDLRSLAS
jgi:uncharacterized membrane protein